MALWVEPRNALEPVMRTTVAGGGVALATPARVRAASPKINALFVFIMVLVVLLCVACLVMEYVCLLMGELSLVAAATQHEASKAEAGNEQGAGFRDNRDGSASVNAQCAEVGAGVGRIGAKQIQWLG